MLNRHSVKGLAHYEVDLFRQVLFSSGLTYSCRRIWRCWLKTTFNPERVCVFQLTQYTEIKEASNETCVDKISTPCFLSLAEYRNCSFVKAKVTRFAHSPTHFYIRITLKHFFSMKPWHTERTAIEFTSYSFKNKKIESIYSNLTEVRLQ